MKEENKQEPKPQPPRMDRMIKSLALLTRVIIPLSREERIRTISAAFVLAGMTEEDASAIAKATAKGRG